MQRVGSNDRGRRCHGKAANVRLVGYEKIDAGLVIAIAKSVNY